jgi:hypothetical protein
MRGRVKKLSEIYEYGWCTSYTRMYIQFLNLLKSLYEGDWDRMLEEANSNMIHCKKFCTCHNIFPVQQK